MQNLTVLLQPVVRNFGLRRCGLVSSHCPAEVVFCMLMFSGDEEKVRRLQRLSGKEAGEAVQK